MIDGIIIKGRYVVIPDAFKSQVLDQLHINHMAIEKTKLLVQESTYWVKIMNNFETFIQNCTTCLTSQQTQSKYKIIHHDILVKPFDVISADMFMLNNKQYLCIVDYHNMFPIIKKTKDLSADSLILVCKIFFAENGMLKKIMPDSGSNFISDKFKTFCKSLNIDQAFSSSYYHQSNGQVDACITFIKHTLKNILIPGVTHT